MPGLRPILLATVTIYDRSYNELQAVEEVQFVTISVNGQDYHISPSVETPGELIIRCNTEGHDPHHINIKPLKPNEIQVVRERTKDWR